MIKPTKKNIDTILKYLPYFSSKNNDFYYLDTEKSLFDPYFYTENTQNFISSLYKENFIQAFDWPNWTHEASIYLENDNSLSNTNIFTIIKLFTTIIRNDRFCSGFLADMIDKGIILKLLLRLKEVNEAKKLTYK